MHLNSLLHASQTPFEKLDANQLEKILNQVERWPDGSTNYSGKNWEMLTLAAKLIQKSDPQSVENFMRKYQGDEEDQFFSSTNLQEVEKKFRERQAIKIDLDKEDEKDGKLFLLLRVVFNLPEHVTTTNVVNFHRFAGWVSYDSEINSDGSINVAWPIYWNHGNPYLVSGNQGLQGFDARYKASDEYDYYRKVYDFRAL